MDVKTIEVPFEVPWEHRLIVMDVMVKLGYNVEIAGGNEFNGDAILWFKKTIKVSPSICLSAPEIDLATAPNAITPCGPEIKELFAKAVVWVHGYINDDSQAESEPLSWRDRPPLL